MDPAAGAFIIPFFLFFMSLLLFLDHRVWLFVLDAR